mmetsp:Transcript_61659/g.55654  ORF Transcript_61659/g.55654 Transcript_61659/m.55654 type:complete len:98 (-) Transcript_61659:93-386(-)
MNQKKWTFQQQQQQQQQHNNSQLITVINQPQHTTLNNKLLFLKQSDGIKPNLSPVNSTKIDKNDSNIINHKILPKLNTMNESKKMDISATTTTTTTT